MPSAYDSREVSTPTDLFREAVAESRGMLAMRYRVEELGELVDLVDGEPRRIDAVLYGTTNTHELVVSIESHTEAQEADLQWVEQMVKKHKTLPTMLLVLVSEAGFDAPATRFAEHWHNRTMVAISPEEERDDQFERIGRGIDELPERLRPKGANREAKRKRKRGARASQ
jgi:hypothetical protein